MTGNGDGLGVEVVSVGRQSRDAAFQLLVRTGAVRVIAFVGTVVLARLLLPDDFGAFAVVIFIVGLLVPFSEMGLGATLVQQRDRPTEIELATAFTAQMVAWLVLVAVAWVLAPMVRLLAPDLPADIEWMVRVVTLGLFINQLRSVPSSMMARVLRFAPLAGIEVTQQIVYTAVAVAAALTGAGAWSFVLGLLALFAVGTSLTFVAWGRLPPIGIDRRVLRRMVGFGVPFQATGLLVNAREALVPLFGGLAGGVAGIGYLQFARRLGRLVGSVDEVIGRVAFPAFSRLQSDKPRLSLAMLHAVETTALLLAPILWTIAVAPTLIPVLFSERWSPAVVAFQLMAFASLAGVPAQFLAGLGFAARRGRPILAVSAIALVLMFVTFPLLILGLGLAGGAIGFVINAVGLLVGYARVTRRLAPFPWVRMLRIYAIGAIAAAVAAVSVVLVSGLPGLILSGIVFLAAYFLLLRVFEPDQLRRSWLLVRGRTALEDAE